MQITIFNLRYKMNDILKTLTRNENVDVLYRGKLKGTIIPKTKLSEKKMIEHPFFNMLNSKEPVEQTMTNLRGGRYSDI